MKKYRFLVIGYPALWHHSKHLVSYLRNEGHIVDEIEGYSNGKKRVREVEIPADIDFVIHFQFHVRPHFTKKNPKTYIIQYSGETYYSPGALNPDFLVTAYPEMLERYVHSNPEIFDDIIDYAQFSIFINPKLFLYVSNILKIEKGIHFMGNTEVPMPYKGAGNYRLYREAYKERKQFIDANSDLIHYHKPSYNEAFIDELPTFEAAIVIHAYMSYFSKRPLENAACGTINIFLVRDGYEEKYLTEMGWKHMQNCLFIHNRRGLSDFYMLDKITKHHIAVNAYKLVMSTFTVKVVWDKILQWVLEHVDPDVPFTTETQKGKWDFWESV
jgi:hypothetical protein